jgi:5-methylcytosine-specific restriction endonuclease McrA
MVWIHWQIRFNNKNQQSPQKWDNFASKLLSVLPKRNVEKIELVSFTAKGNRKLRWLLQNTNPEYCTKNEAIKIAKRLAFLMLNSNGSSIPTNLEKDFPKSRFKREITKCPLCKKIIDLTDFDRNGQKDLESIQIDHEIPLSQQLGSHNSKNVFWIHRRCNYIKGEQTTKQSLLSLVELIKNHLV